ncbi:ATP-binding cassette domain-containing protein [Streptomyces sp. NPDC002088]|uniref:ABC transporter ATP-binding protein n=1 Tax=Streptomyces sp. NPDC002088 TaxID=3154665 RepID=UPI00331B1D09
MEDSEFHRVCRNAMRETAAQAEALRQQVRHVIGELAALTTADGSMFTLTPLAAEVRKELELIAAEQLAELDTFNVVLFGRTGVGMDRPTRGEIWLAGHRLDMLGERALARLRRAHVGFGCQSFHLMDELSAVENVEFPALSAGCGRRRARRRAVKLLEQVGLGDRVGHLPSALSGGQRQRVAIARVLANTPSLILADEPTGNLDSAATRDVLRLFADRSHRPVRHSSR